MGKALITNRNCYVLEGDLDFSNPVVYCKTNFRKKEEVNPFSKKSFSQLFHFKLQNREMSYMCLKTIGSSSLFREGLSLVRYDSFVCCSEVKLLCSNRV